MTRDRSKTTRNQRNARGSAVEGVVGLWMVVLALVLGTLLIANAGFATYFKEKIAFVANQAADYAAVLPPDATRNGLVVNEVKQLMTSMGYPTNNLQVTVTDMTVIARPAVKVTITAPFSAVFGNVGLSVIPPVITVSDSAVALSNGWYPAYLQVVDLQGQMATGLMIVDASGQPATGAPNDRLPAYSFNYFTALQTLRLGGLLGGLLGPLL